MGEALAGGAGIGGAWGEDAEPGVGGGKGVGSRLRLELQMAEKRKADGPVHGGHRLWPSPGSQHGAEPAETMGETAGPTVPPCPPGEPETPT